ncbi:MAG: polysaccharide deacetylase family protein [bacterium]
MRKIILINLLHFYQPPSSGDETVIEAAEKSYKKIISALKRNPEIKFTINIAGCLLERLEILGYHGLISDLKKMLEIGQIELTGSAAFHPILPLLPDEEIKRNIEANQKIFKKYFGENFKAAGFFPPELAYSQDLCEIISSYGYEWIALDEISAYGALNQVDFSKLYIEKNTGMKICFRSRQLSKSYAPKAIFDLINSGFSGIAITATDAELYGLRHEDFTGTFEKLLKRPEIETKTASEFLAGFKDGISISPVASSWESSEDELKKSMPYALWRDKKNKIQKLLWKLTYSAISSVNQYRDDANFFWSRRHLDRGLASCTFWWASARDFKMFGSISWNPDEIEKGAEELIKSVRAISDPKSKSAKIKAEKLYIKIKTLIWHKHWNYYWLK